MYATNAKLDAEMQKREVDKKREEDKKRFLESDIHKWYLLIKKMKCFRHKKSVKVMEPRVYR
jgi:hypothetical protein